MIDCLFIGSATKDLLMTVDAPPESDQRIRATSITNTCGGIASVSASAFQKLGGDCGLITAVGKPSDATDFIKADILSRKLSFSKIISIPDEESSFSVIQIEASGKRCITHFGGCIRSLTLDMLDKQALRSAKMIHVGGLEDSFCAELVKYCKENTDAKISVDGGNLTRKATDEILPYTDIFVPDDKTVMKTLGLSPKEACLYYAGKGVETVCVTMGEKGSIAYQNGEFTEAEAVAVDVVDSTGAGDNFHGAFLYCLMQGWEMDLTLNFCNTFAGLTCAGMGGRQAEPTLEETLNKLSEENGGKKWHW